MDGLSTAFSGSCLTSQERISLQSSILKLKLNVRIFCIPGLKFVLLAEEYQVFESFRRNLTFSDFIPTQSPSCEMLQTGRFINSKTFKF